ncbi:MAG: alpha/beta hydrolase, partial [Duncaniella sp.]|nr:alpha/beta hydrolase [Duncaniella sp.]
MDKDITLDGQRLHYTDTVEGARAIVMMHGWGCDHSTLALVERVAVACGYRVLNVDFPGFGLSPEPEEVWGVERYTRLIEKFVEAVGLTDYSL